MIEFDVLAVVGNEAETLHVELAGAVADGSRTDITTGAPVEIIGHVWAADTAAAHVMACAEFCPADDDARWLVLNRAINQVRFRS